MQRFLKESFPFGYHIVNHVQGDVNQVLPEGITVYFTKDQEITEFKVAQNKKIFHFARDGIVQMEQQKGKGLYKEVFNGRKWKIVEPDGKTEVRNFNNYDF